MLNISFFRCFRFTGIYSVPTHTLCTFRERGYIPLNEQPKTNFINIIIRYFLKTLRGQREKMKVS